MSNLLTFPSDQFPALTPLQMSAPQGWEPLTAVGVHLGVVKPMSAGQFTPNLIVEITGFGGIYTLAQAVDLVQRNAGAAKGYKFTRREEITFAGTQGYVLDGVVPQPRGGALMQTVRLAVIDRGSVVDLVQATGTCAKAQEPLAWATLHEIADSISQV